MGAEARQRARNVVPDRREAPSRVALGPPRRVLFTPAAPATVVPPSRVDVSTTTEDADLDETEENGDTMLASGPTGSQKDALYLAGLTRS